MAEKPGCAKTGCGCVLVIAVGFCALLVLLSMVPTVMPPQAGAPQNAAAQADPLNAATTDKNVISGLQAVDVYLNLTNKGFEKKGPRKLVDMIETTCESVEAFGTLHVSIVGPSVGPVSYVVASGTNTSREQTGALMADFFGYIATIPYDDAEPENAKRWVIENINRNAQRRFGSAQFEIIANAERARILKITVAK
jgi:hypothetical protein